MWTKVFLDISHTQHGLLIFHIQFQVRVPSVNKENYTVSRLPGRSENKHEVIRKLRFPISISAFVDAERALQFISISFYFASQKLYLHFSLLRTAEIMVCPCGLFDIKFVGNRSACNNFFETIKKKYTRAASRDPIIYTLTHVRNTIVFVSVPLCCKHHFLLKAVMIGHWNTVTRHKLH